MAHVLLRCCAHQRRLHCAASGFDQGAAVTLSARDVAWPVQSNEVLRAAFEDTDAAHSSEIWW